MEYVTVRDVRLPAIGFGTARTTGAECRVAVEDALELGYRHVDTAPMYDNEAAVGAALESAAVDREDVFLTTKVHRSDLAREDVRRSLERSRQRLGTDPDLLLVHAPSGAVPIEETMAAMNDLQAEGRVDHVGVSNFSADELAAAIEASDAPILTNQVECNPFQPRPKLRRTCVENGVLLTAYSPLAVGRACDSDVLRSIGARHGKTAAQVALRWLVQQEDVAAIPKAVQRDHREENLAIFDFALSESEMERIGRLGRGLIGRLRSRIGI